MVSTVFGYHSISYISMVNELLHEDNAQTFQRSSTPRVYTKGRAKTPLAVESPLNCILQRRWPVLVMHTNVNALSFSHSQTLLLPFSPYSSSPFSLWLRWGRVEPYKRLQSHNLPRAIQSLTTWLCSISALCRDGGGPLFCSSVALRGKKVSDAFLCSVKDL